MNRFSEVVIHHSGGPRTQTVVSITRHHIQEKGWDDIGYHYIVDGQARRHVGRRLPAQGAHAPPNHGRIGLLIIGNNLKPRSAWTADQINEGRAVCADLWRLFPWLTFHGHGSLMRPGYTECPGVDLRGIFPEFIKG